jgi:hypothetical protein
MADIQQAARWMQEGKRVRSPGGKAGEPTNFTDVPRAHPNFADAMHGDELGRIFTDEGVPVSLMLSAILRDDWELAD